MSNETQDRQRTRQDLQALAKMAKAKPSAFETADSSGYVDLSAFSSTDESWVDRELERAKKGAPPPPPARGRSAAIHALAPESMAPVALAALLEVPAEEVPPARRGRKALYAIAGVASIAAVAWLAVVVARQAPPPASSAAAVAAPPAVAAVDPAPAAPAAPPADTAASTSPSAPSATAANVTTATPTSAGARSKKKSVAPARAAAVAARPAAARPVAIPASKPSGGDSLMDMMRASVKQH